MRFLFPLALLSALASAPAQTNWTGGGDGFSWTQGTNWSSGVPTDTSAVTINVQPQQGFIGVAGGDFTIASLSFGSALTAPNVLTPGGVGDRLLVNGLVSNSGTNRQAFTIPVIAGTGFALSAGAGGLDFTSLDIGSRTVATSGLINITSRLVFDLNSTSSYGSIGSINAAGASITIANPTSYVFQAGDTFDLTTGNFAGANPNVTLPSLTGSLSWDTSQFLASGTLTVVPEPAGVALIGLGLLFTLAVARRRFRAHGA